MKRFAVFCLCLASPAFAGDFDMRWFDTPGEWLVQGYVPPPFFPDCSAANWCASVAVEVRFNERMPCIRYEDVYVLRNGKRVPDAVEEDGVRGEVGWTWRFRTTGQLWAGPFQFHVKTVDVCPKVG